MKQTNSVSKIAEEGFRNRKLNLSRSSKQNQDGLKETGRFKSNQEIQKPDSATNIPLKPRSSLSRRPQSAYKNTETINSIATTSSARSEGEVREVIQSIFQYSKKLHEFLSEKNLDEKEASKLLIGNELFTLSLVPLISNKSIEDVNKSVERVCIHKLERILALEKQKNICNNLETKIEELLNNRIKSLSIF